MLGLWDSIIKLRTDAEINWILQNNLRFLEDYFRGTLTTVEAITTGFNNCFSRRTIRDCFSRVN